MIIAVLVVAGLCLGSFVNALVWRVREQQRLGKNKNDSKHQGRLSIIKGRSMCPQCCHELTVKDLLPVLSWLGLKGKCRYCAKPIPVQYPIVELTAAVLFVASYLWWPVAVSGIQVAIFGLWLVLLTGLLALLVYDLRWMLLPNRIMYPLAGIAVLQAILTLVAADEPLKTLTNMIASVAVGGGVFYMLFQISKGKWIGGGDVKLGWLLGLIAGAPERSLLLIFLAALGGSLISLPLLAGGRLKRHSTVPFGPFLIAAFIVVQLFGSDILEWYRDNLLGLG